MARPYKNLMLARLVHELRQRPMKWREIAELIEKDTYNVMRLNRYYVNLSPEDKRKIKSVLQ